MVIQPPFFVVGPAALIVGAELLVRGASKLALEWGISPLVVGLTLVVFGTTDSAIGDAVGSNVFNVLVILGVSALIALLAAAGKGDRDIAVGNVVGSNAFNVLDGFALAVRCAKRVVRMVLAVVGVVPDGQKRSIALELAASESEEAWKGLLAGLVARGLKAPLAATLDGCLGLRQALAAVWPSLPVQRCMVHQLRNLLAMSATSRSDIPIPRGSNRISRLFRAKASYQRRHSSNCHSSCV